MGISLFVYLFVVLSHVVADTTFDSVNRVQQMTYRHIVIQCINNESDIFAHVTVDIVWSGYKLRCLID